MAGILATVITADLDAMCRRLANICRVREADPAIAAMIWGIHIEGPFLNEQPGYIGAHPAQFARPADIDTMQRLLDAAEGLTKIVTLAPERDDKAQRDEVSGRTGDSRFGRPLQSDRWMRCELPSTRDCHYLRIFGNGCPGDAAAA